MKTHIIQLERFDDVTSVADKIAWSRANRALLVWPRRGRVLTQFLDLLLIQRACQNVGAQLACVVDDDTILDHAQELGIPVFHSAKTAQRILWRRSRQKKSFDPKPMQPRAMLEGQIKAARPIKASWVERRWLRWSLFFLGLGAVLLAALLILPDARIGLVLAQDQQSIELPVYASPELAVLNLSGGLPVAYLSVVMEGHDEQPATGSILIGDIVTTGMVLFTNLTDKPVEIPAGTRVQTIDEPVIQFETLRENSLPASPGVSIMVSVQALQPGNQGNVQPGAIQAVNGEVGAMVKVTNPSPTLGGRDLTTRAVSKDDLDSLRQNLLSGLEQEALQEIQTRLLPGQRLFPETLQAVKVLREQQNPAAGAAAERVSLDLQVEFRVWTIRETDLAALASVALDANLPNGTTGLRNSLVISDTQTPVLDQGQIHWQIRATRVLQASWDSQTVIRAVAGHGVEEARQVLAQQIHVEQPPEIELHPAWWPVFPLLPARIEVVVQ